MDLIILLGCHFAFTFERQREHCYMEVKEEISPQFGYLKRTKLKTFVRRLRHLFDALILLLIAYFFITQIRLRIFKCNVKNT